MVLVNPNAELLVEYETQLFLARKTKPVWARRVEVEEPVQTLEGCVVAKPGDYVCRGLRGELWPQKASKLQETYVASGVAEGVWQRFDPRPDSPPVHAAQIPVAFQVQAQWGLLTGKAQDYVVRSTSNPSDIWLVDGAIFEATYDRVEG
jgi:hypothetical protein